MTGEKYVFYVSVPTIKKKRKRENYQIYIFSKQYIHTHTQHRKVVFYPNDFIQTNKESPEESAKVFK